MSLETSIVGARTSDVKLLHHFLHVKVNTRGEQFWIQKVIHPQPELYKTEYRECRDRVEHQHART